MFDFWQKILGLVLGLVFLSGLACQKGVAPVWSTANPSTEITVNPVTKTITVFNNKDVDVTLEEFSGGTAGGTTWKVKNVKIIDGASGVREANIGQMKAGTEMTAAAFDGATKLVTSAITAAMPALTEYIKAHPASAKDPTILEGVIKSAMNQVIEGGLKPDGTPLVPIKLPGQ